MENIFKNNNWVKVGNSETYFKGNVSLSYNKDGDYWELREGDETYANVIVTNEDIKSKLQNYDHFITKYGYQYDILSDTYLHPKTLSHATRNEVEIYGKKYRVTNEKSFANLMFDKSLTLQSMEDINNLLEKVGYTFDDLSSYWISPCGSRYIIISSDWIVQFIDVKDPKKNVYNLSSESAVESIVKTSVSPYYNYGFIWTINGFRNEDFTIKNDKLFISGEYLCDATLSNLELVFNQKGDITISEKDIVSHESIPGWKCVNEWDLIYDAQNRFVTLMYEKHVVTNVKSYNHALKVMSVK